MPVWQSDRRLPEFGAGIPAAFDASGAEFLVTTEKDAVKLSPSVPPFDGLPLRYLRIGLDIEAGFTERLEAALRKTGLRPGGSI